MKIRKHKMWPIILIAIIITMFTTFLGTEYIAAVTVNNYQKDNQNFDKSFDNVTTLVRNELNNYKDTLHAFSLIISNAMKNGQKIHIDLLLNTMKTTNHFDALHIISQYNVSSKVKDNVILQTHDHLVFYSYIPAANSYLYGTISMERVYNFMSNLIKDEVYDIYLLDNDKNIVISMYNKPLNYHDIVKEDFYSEDNRYSEFQNSLYNIIDCDANPFTDFSLSRNTYSAHELLASIRHYFQLSQSDSYLWFEHPITIDDNCYTFLTAKKATFSKETIVTSMQASLIVGIIIFICFTVWIVFIIFQCTSNRRLYKTAFIDSITKYNNASKFRLETNKLIRKHKKQCYALVLLDIDNFKIINDLYGYENANGVLKNVSDSIRTQLLKKETCTRYAADEFMILLKYDQESDIKDRVIKMNQYILMKSTIPNIKFSYGVYFIKDYTLSVEQMSIYAGMAKDTIKGLKDEYIGFFNESIRQAQIRDKELENESEGAFLQKEFVVFLQPKYDAVTKRIGGAEALVRWISPSLGFISPGEFIPLFEKNHMIIRLDNYMLEEVCRQQRQWMDEGKELVTISVNISRVHLTIDGLIDDILSVVDRYEIPHQFIELELTESAFFDEKEKLLQVVSTLQKNGFLVSMDDFGSGYSSLNSLKDLPMDVIKLDGEFFRTTNNTERSETVIRDTISLAKHLQMKIVAEGVETKDQVDFLNGIGCDLIQGFYFAKPMPIADFEKMCYETQEPMN